MKEYCFKCDDMMDAIVKKKKEAFKIKGEPIEILNEVLFCKKCNSEMSNEEYDSKSLERAFAEYRKRHNILSPKEIKSIREKYKISQKDFALILGFGEITITRYENGMIPDKPYSELIKMMENKANFLKALKESRLSDKEKSRIIEKMSVFDVNDSNVKSLESVFSTFLKIASPSILIEEAKAKKSKSKEVKIECDLDRCEYGNFGEFNLGVENG
ncbi:MAG: type II toxin-antitoxin system MqsA family antitoxin [bacterium]|nr:type II toxin-antitoxin system MqsA family antitoxin [bacterium]